MGRLTIFHDTELMALNLGVSKKEVWEKEKETRVFGKKKECRDRRNTSGKGQI